MILLYIVAQIEAVGGEFLESLLLVEGDCPTIVFPNSQPDIVQVFPVRYLSGLVDEALANAHSLVFLQDVDPLDLQRAGVVPFCLGLFEIEFHVCDRNTEVPDQEEHREGIVQFLFELSDAEVFVHIGCDIIGGVVGKEGLGEGLHTECPERCKVLAITVPDHEIVNHDFDRLAPMPVKGSKASW